MKFLKIFNRITHDEYTVNVILGSEVVMCQADKLIFDEHGDFDDFIMLKIFSYFSSQLLKNSKKCNRDNDHRVFNILNTP